MCSQSETEHTIKRFPSIWKGAKESDERIFMHVHIARLINKAEKTEGQMCNVLLVHSCVKSKSSVLCIAVVCTQPAGIVFLAKQRQGISNVFSLL